MYREGRISKATLLIGQQRRDKVKSDLEGLGVGKP